MTPLMEQLQLVAVSEFSRLAGVEVIDTPEVACYPLVFLEFLFADGTLVDVLLHVTMIRARARANSFFIGFSSFLFYAF